MSAKEDLDKMLTEYITIANNRLSDKESIRVHNIYKLKTRSDLNNTIRDIESLDIFENIIDLTREIYSNDFFIDRSVTWDNNLEDFGPEWSFLIKVFFRKSGAYYKLLNNIKFNKHNVLKSFNDCFQIREVNVRFLAPLEFIDFKPKKPIDFGHFLIRKFSEHDLSKLVQNDINKLFFPDSLWDTKILCNYWFLDIPKHKVRTDLLLQSFWTLIFNKNRRHNKFIYDEIQTIIDTLMLFNWNLNNKKLICQGFNLPFISVIDNYYLAYPDDSPDITKLKLDMSRVDHVEGDIFDENFRKPKLMKPPVYFQYRKKERERFINEINMINNLLNNPIIEKYPFIRKAFEYCRKAQFTHEPSKASEQLLWNVIAIEAMLSRDDKDGQNTRNIGQRLASILGKNSDEIKLIQDKFNMIYSLRSRLVHGSAYDDNKLREILFDARNLVRDSCIWFLNLFYNLRKNYYDGQSLPTLQDIQEVINYPNEHRQRIKIHSELIDAFPE